MVTQKLDTELRREQIAQAALNLVATYGLRDLSMARIAHRVGLVPSAIYRHFQGKDQVLDATLNLIRERLLGNVDEVCEETEDSLERLYRLLMRHIRLLRENEPIPQIVYSHKVYGDSPIRKARMYRIIRDYLDRVSAVIRHGQQAGKIRPEIDQETASVMFLGLIQPPTILWHLSEGRFDVTKHAERAWRIFRESIEVI